ncbi:MAG: HU family DNA-binding protein [Bacteroidales bacterium]
MLIRKVDYRSRTINQILATISTCLKIRQVDIFNIVESMLQMCVEHLMKNKKLVIPGVATFEIYRTKSRKRNICGKIVMVPSKNKLRVKPSKYLETRIENDNDFNPTSRTKG